MLGSDLLLGFVLAKLFGKGGEPATASPRAIRQNGAHAHAHARAQAQPSAATPNAFPANVDVPSTNTTAPAEFKKAIEVWSIRPDVASQVTNPVLVGMVGQVNDATAISALESSFPAGWQPNKTATAAEQSIALSLLKQWHDGGVVFMGPETMQGRRAYRMTKHPKDATSPAPAPVPVPAHPGETQPASFPVPLTPGPAAAPAPAASDAPPPFVPGIPDTSAQAVVTVQPGEGLAQVAKRLGQPANATSAKALRDANVPNGPDGHTWKATSLTDAVTRGIKRTDRSGGLQPGDRLFVPKSWGTM